MGSKWGAILLIGALAAPAIGQTSSISKRRASVVRPAEKTTGDDPRNLNSPEGNPTLEKFGLTAVRVDPPRKFKPHDLITIIIREQRAFESDGALETKKRFDIAAEVGAFFKPIDGGLGASTFSRGKPNVDLRYDHRVKNESDKDREDSFVTRITGEVVDVKPNGNLVIEAKAHINYENEKSTVTITGVVRSEDVTPDNTVLSTQVAAKVIDVQNTGAVRDGTRRGWVPRLLEFLSPF